MREPIYKYCNVISGYAFAAQDLKEIESVPVIKIGNISSNYGVIEKDMQYVSDDFTKIDSKYHVCENDILITLTGSHINQPNSVVGRSCRKLNKTLYLLNQRAGKVIPYEGLVDNNYLFYVFQTNIMKTEIVNRAYGGANQVNVSPKDIMRIKWDFHEFDTQKKIGQILSQYDEFIENKKNRIRILEQTAQEIYKEWFVRFRFPDYKNTKFENGIPENWKVKRIKDFGKIITGKTPSTVVEEYYGDFIPFVKTPDMHNHWFIESSSEMLSQKGSLSTKSTYIPEKSIIVSCIGTVGVVSMNLIPVHTNQQINSIVLHENKYLYWLFMQLKNMKKTIEMYGATGATMLNLSKGKFEKLKVLTPNYELLDRFSKIIEPIFNEIILLNKKNDNLIRQRDLLLPRLMSGKLEVK